MDLFGPLPDFLGTARHFFVILDSETDLALASTLKTASEAGNAIQAWISQLELQAGERVKRVRCEGARELVSADMRAVYTSRGIRLVTTAEQTSQQNRKAKHLKRTLMERVWSILAEAWLGDELWAEALMAVFYNLNPVPTSDEKATPFERFYGKRPDVYSLRV